MFDRLSYKQNARVRLRGNYGPAVLVVFIFGVITMGLSGLTLSGSSVASLLNLASSGVLNLAFTIFFLKYAVKSPETKIVFGDFLSALSSWITGILSFLWFVLWSMLWLFLFIIPGCIKMVAYSQMFFILAENPDISVKKSMKMSMVMTRGYKGELFVMGMSFFGWILLSCLTCGILLLWTIPYVSVSFANAYLYLKAEALRSGILTEADFGVTTTDGEPSNV